MGDTEHGSWGSDQLEGHIRQEEARAMHKADLHSCANCEMLWKSEELEEITHGIWERVQPGEIMPSGECPNCTCLCHPIYAPAVIACDYWDSQERDTRENFKATREQNVIQADKAARLRQPVPGK